MFVTASSLPRRATALVAAFALAASLLLAGLVAAPAFSANYPTGQKKAFMKSCVPAAVSSSGGNLSKAQATQYCRSALKCIEAKLTLSQFETAVSAPKSHNGKIVNRCEKRAIAEVLS
jgi:hypothetical protein